MRVFIITLFVFVIGYSVRQRWVIHQLSELVRECSRESLKMSSLLGKSEVLLQFEMPPIGEVSSVEYLEYLTAINAFEQPEERADLVYAWISTLTTQEALQEALNALTGHSIPSAEKTVLVGRFGPALLAQWGKVDPKGGMEAWYGLNRKIRQNLLGEDCSTHDEFYVNHSVSPKPLLESWIHHDVHGLLKELPDFPPNASEDTCRLLSDSHPFELLDYFDNVEHFSPRKVEEFEGGYFWVSPLGGATGVLTEGSQISNENLRSIVLNQFLPRVTATLIEENGSVEAALSAIASEPDNEVRRELRKQIQAYPE